VAIVLPDTYYSEDGGCITGASNQGSGCIEAFYAQNSWIVDN